MKETTTTGGIGPQEALREIKGNDETTLSVPKRQADRIAAKKNQERNRY